MRICEIINVGTELLLGEILNTNAQFLCRELAAMGIGVQRVLTVGDNQLRLRTDFQLALSRSDIVLLTGGLGPTKDDLTKEVVCEALELPLEEDPEQLRLIEAFFAQRSIPFAQSNRKQALVPAGCTVLYNENGTAPGCFIQAGEKCIALLPGPPRELQPMFVQKLAPLLAPYSSGAIVSHHLRTIGLGESRMAELAGTYLDSENPTVAPYAKDGEAYLRVSACAPTKKLAEQLCAPVLEDLQKILGDFTYSIDKELPLVLLERLRDAGKTLAIAESCTGGGIAASLTDLPGASAVFRYGFVTYANEAKVQLLDVSCETLSRFGAVSREVAAEMACGALRASGADLTVAITGIAGPDAAGIDKPAGLIYLCATDGARTEHLKLLTGRADRGYNRVYAAKQAMALVLKLLS
jgi:nicotinamide-nucleotide amidase